MTIKCTWLPLTFASKICVVQVRRICLLMINNQLELVFWNMCTEENTQSISSHLDPRTYIQRPNIPHSILTLVSIIKVQCFVSHFSRRRFYSGFLLCFLTLFLMFCKCYYYTPSGIKKQTNNNKYFFY